MTKIHVLVVGNLLICSLSGYGDEKPLFFWIGLILLFFIWMCGINAKTVNGQQRAKLLFYILDWRFSVLHCYVCAHGGMLHACVAVCCDALHAHIFTSSPISLFLTSLRFSPICSLPSHPIYPLTSHCSLLSPLIVFLDTLHRSCPYLVSHLSHPRSPDLSLSLSRVLSVLHVMAYPSI